MKKFNQHQDQTINNVTKDIQSLTIDCQGIEGYIPSIIESDSEQIISAERVKYIGGIIRQIKEVRKSYTKPLDDLKKKIMAVEKGNLELLQDIEKKYKHVIRTYDDKKQEEISQARIEAERIQKAEELNHRIAAEKARENHTIDGAVSAIEHENKADKISNTDVEIIVNKPPKVSKLLTRRNYKAEIVDNDKVPRQYMVPDMVALNSLARQTKGDITFAPAGVTFVEVEL